MKFVQARNYTKAARTSIDLIVIHDMEYPERPTAAEWCADFFAGPSAPKASAHYCVDGDSIVQCVRDEDVAWHAPGANAKGIGIEHAGYAKQTAAEWADSYSAAMLEISAGLTAELCHKYGIPAVRPSVEELKAGARGIIGHKDATDAWSGGKGHYDPGPGFPWDRYLRRVRERLSLLELPPASSDRGLRRVACNGVEWLVSPIYVGPIGIAEAADLAARMGYELPTPALVDAIWQAADLRLDPHGAGIKENALVRSDFKHWTMTEMSSQATIEEQVRRITRQLAGRSYTLLAGAFKDVVRSETGELGIYGWHDLQGHAIQGFYPHHVRGWRDYSQALRLCRRAT